LFGGLDIGSRSVSLVELLNGDYTYRVEEISHSPLEKAQELIEDRNFRRLVATGYGRHAAKARYAHEVITEIKAYALGACFFLPEVRTILDIGGQDTKVILLDEKGNVVDFQMNEKCSAGTGKFLEVMAKALGYSLQEFGACALKSEKKIRISSMCTVFAESEVISLLHEGEKREDIAYALHNSIVERAAGLLKRVGIKEPLFFAGGVAKNPCVRELLREKLKVEVFVPEEPQIVGALGAALYAEAKG
jgi:predicted CoA-substrate-specific enzyme activase